MRVASQPAIVFPANRLPWGIPMCGSVRCTDPRVRLGFVDSWPRPSQGCGSAGRFGPIATGSSQPQLTSAHLSISACPRRAPALLFTGGASKGAPGWFRGTTLRRSLPQVGFHSAARKRWIEAGHLPQMTIIPLRCGGLTLQVLSATPFCATEPVASSNFQSNLVRPLVHFACCSTETAASCAPGEFLPSGS